MQPVRIAIIGAGWTGCHLALSLLESGFDVTLLEKRGSLLQGASAVNQCRLHLGFHYPRAYETVEQLRHAYPRFLARYGHFTRAVKQNIYAIADRNSLLDLKSYELIMESHGLSFKKAHPKMFGLHAVEGCMVCEERAIDIPAARQFFKSVLSPFLRLGHTVENITPQGSGVQVDGETFDLAINATYLQFGTERSADFCYQSSVMLAYSSRSFGDRALTIMDGPFGSIYPCPRKRSHLYLLSSVEHTVLETHEKYSEAARALEKIDSTRRIRVRKEMEQVISEFYPRFSSEFEYQGLISAVKTKPISDSAGLRECWISEEGGLITAFAAKISHVMLLEQKIKRCLGKRFGADTLRKSYEDSRTLSHTLRR